MSPDESSLICPLAPFRATGLIVKWSYGLKFSPSGQPVFSLFLNLLLASLVQVRVQTKLLLLLKQPIQEAIGK